MFSDERPDETSAERYRGIVFLKGPFTNRVSVVKALEAGTQVECLVAAHYDPSGLFREGSLLPRSVQTLRQRIFENDDISWWNSQILLTCMFAEACVPKSTAAYGWLGWKSHVQTPTHLVLSPYHPDGIGYADCLTAYTTPLQAVNGTRLHGALCPSMNAGDGAFRLKHEGMSIKNAFYQSLIGYDLYPKWMITTICDERLKVHVLHRDPECGRVSVILVADSSRQRRLGERLPRFLVCEQPDGSFSYVDITNLV